MKPRLSTISLDGDVVRGRRLELNMSERTLAAHLGGTFSTAIVRSIERGQASLELTLRDVCRYAEVLNVPVHAVLRTDEPPGSPAAMDGDDELAGQVGTLLASLAQPVHVDVLADAVSRDLDAVEDMLTVVAARVERAGLEVRRVGRTVALAPAFRGVSGEQLRAAARQHLARAGLDVSQALLVSRVARGLRTKSLTNPERVTAGSLKNAGILEHAAAGGFQLSADAAFSLLAEGGNREQGTRRSPDESE